MFPEVAEQENLVVEAVWRAEVVLVSNSPVQSRLSLSQLAKTPFVLFQRGSLIENLIDAYFASLHFRPRVVMRFDDTESIKAMVRSGLGMSMLPYWSVCADLDRGTMHLVGQKDRKLDCQVVIVSRTKTSPSGPAGCFIEMARKFAPHRLRLAPRTTPHGRARANEK